MALTRKFLMALEIDSAKIEEIISAHSETVEALKSETADLRAKYKDYDDIKVKLSEAETQLKTVADDDYKSKYENIKSEYENYKNDVVSKAEKDAKVNAYKDILKSVGVSDKRIDTILKVTDLNTLTLKDGKIANESDVAKSIKDEWSDFIVTTSEQGASVTNPPANNGGSTFDGMNLADKMTYANEHPNSEAVRNWLSN